MVIRSWRDARPYVGHDTKIIWSIFRAKGSQGTSPEEGCLEGMTGVTLHRLQPGGEGDYHDHADTEQVYYFTSGRGKMKIDGQLYQVRSGDAVHLPPACKHQMINDSDDWVEHLILSARVSGRVPGA